MKNDTPVTGLVSVAVSDGDSSILNVLSKNYVHNRLTDNFIQYYTNTMLRLVIGTGSKLTTPYYSILGSYDQPFPSFSARLETLVLAKGTPVENNPFDDSLLEADTIDSVTYLDPGAYNSTYYWRQGTISDSSKTRTNGDIDIVIEYDGTDHLEFDTVYLAGAQNLYRPNDYPVESLEYRHRTSVLDIATLEQDWGTDVSNYGCNGLNSYSVNGNGLFFMSEDTFMIVVGVKSRVLHLVKYKRVNTNSNTAYSDGEVLEHIKVPLSDAKFDVTPSNGYSIADITAEGKIYMIVDTSNNRNSNPDGQVSVNTYSRRPVKMHVLDFQGTVDSSCELERTYDLSGGYGDSIRVGDYIYVISSVMPPYYIHSNSAYDLVGGRVSNNSTRTYGGTESARPALCKYTLSGKLVGTRKIADSRLSGTGSLQAAVVLHHLYYDAYSKNIIVYESLYASSTTSSVYKIDPDTMTLTLSSVKARGFKLAYNTYENRLYSIGASQLTEPNKLAVSPRHIAPISTKCKLPSKVVKKAGQTMTLTYKLRAGSPVE